MGVRAISGSRSGSRAPDADVDEPNVADIPENPPFLRLAAGWFQLPEEIETALQSAVRSRTLR